MKVCIVLGTRPEIIKMSPVIRACEKFSDVEYFLIHTGQHYSYELDKRIFEDLELKEPKYGLKVGSMPFRKQIGLMKSKIHEILEKENPDILLVQGDTNSVLAGAIAGSSLNIPVGHIEAGLRSHDLSMTEETNRIVTDHLSSLLFAPTQESVANLKEEGITEKVFLTGNTILDAVQQNLEIANQKADILKKLGIKKGEYALVTVHRAENTDIKERLEGILHGLRLIAQDTGSHVIFPIHPRTEKMIEEFQLEKPDNVRFIKPLGFLEFIQLESNSRIILTDSGGLQEEACILKIPCVTLRDNTERPETVALGMNILAGTDPDNILRSAKEMLDRKIAWDNPFGDGNAGENIVRLSLKNI